jgi:hypothetical protein
VAETVTDYKDWLSRFLGIYRYAVHKETTHVNAALEWLEQTKPSGEELEKIWAAQVANNIDRDKSLRKNPRAMIKRDPKNILSFFEKRRWDRVIETQTEHEYETATCQTCNQKPATQHTNQCAWCYSQEHCNSGPTGLDKLREGYKKRIPQLPGEHPHAYLFRVYGSKGIVARDSRQRPATSNVPDNPKTEIRETEPVDSLPEW